MGAVFLAVDRKLERQVAIKVLPPDLAHDEQFVQRFEHEARTAAKLDHPGIVPIYAVEAEDDLHYFVMKYVQGRPLDGVLRSGPLPVDLSQQILWESACALGHAHHRGVVHRDIKPANIMLDEAGHALLTDFGISKALESKSHFTATGQVIGTPHYMSPEQARGEEVGGASDQYSLAVVGYRMLTGRLPFEDDSVHTVIYKHVFEMPPPLRSFREEVPPFLAEAIHRAVMKDPFDRHANMEAFATAVWPENPVTPTGRNGHEAVTRRRSLSSISEPTAISEPTGIDQPTTGRRRRVVPVLLPMLLTGALAAAAWFTPQGRDLLGRAGIGLRTAGAESGPNSTTPGDESGALLGAALVDSGSVEDSTTANPPPETETPATRQDPPPTPQPVRQDPRPRQVQPAPPRVGYLTLDATPSGLVLVDGRELRDTPLYRLELTVGRHVIEIQREGYRTFREELTISSGNETRKRVTLEKEGV
jgi:serine/threonine protein kinase